MEPSSDQATAYHEAGHAVLALLLSRPVARVSILPDREHLGVCEFGKGVFRPSDSTLRTFDPAATSNNSYYTVYNPVTGEIYVNEPFPAGGGSSRTVFVIAPVPEPGTFILAIVGIGLLCSRLALSRKAS
jgi:hypothetical protein